METLCIEPGRPGFPYVSMEDRALFIQISGDGVSPAGQLTKQHVSTRGLVYSGHLLVNGYTLILSRV